MARLDRCIMTPGEVGTAFHATPSPGMFRKFGPPMAYAYTPLSLAPTPAYYQAIGRILSRAGFTPSEKKLPFRLDLPVLGNCRLSARFHLYPPRTAVISLRLETDETIDDVERLFALKKVETSPVFSSLVRASLGVLNSGDHREPAPVPSQSYPAVHLVGADSPGDFSQWPEHDRKRLVGLLIGNRSFDRMSGDIVARVAASNAEFNKKTTDELLLLNKQGLLFLTGADGRRATGERFDRYVDLVEIALAFSAFLRHYPGGRAGVEEFSDYTYWRIRSWVRRYGAIFSGSMSNRFLWQHLVHEFGLDARVEMTDSDNPWLDEKIESQTQFFASLSENWWSQPEYAATFATSSDSPDLRELSFIADPELRSAILMDMREASRALAARSFKSATIMAGAVVEAMLLDALMSRTPLSHQALLNDNLSGYVRRARAAQLGLDDAVLNIVDQTMREWRNLVHPGRQLRLNVKIDEPKAIIAVHAMHALAAELAK